MLCYLNGAFLPVDQASVSVLDRGFLLGDGVYEALRAFGGVAIAMDRHVRRLRESLEAVGIDYPAEQLATLTDELLARGGVGDAFVYWQFTRGVPAPNQPWRTRTPSGAMTPTVFGVAAPVVGLSALVAPATVRVRLCADQRWRRGLIKSISLMGNVLAAMEAGENGAAEAIMCAGKGDKARVTEACASNVIIVKNGRLATPSLDHGDILAGITRARVLDTAPEVEERDVTVGELLAADEVLFCGTTSLVSSVTHIDGKPVGSGASGPWAGELYARLIRATREEVERSRRTVAAAG